MKLATDVGSPIDYEFRVIIRCPYIKLTIFVHKATFCTFIIPPLVCLENIYLFAYKLSYMSQYLFSDFFFFLYIYIDLQVTNLGKPLTSFGTASMIIEWPKHNSQGKWLLYLMKMTPTGLDSFSCSNKDEVNKLGLKV